MAQIPPRYFERGFDAYVSRHRSQDEALKKAVDYVESFPDVPAGLLFVGPCGVGKTHLSVAIVKDLIQEQQVSARFVDETEFLRRLQYSYGPDSPDTEREVLLPLMQVDILVWDDLGTGRPTDWARETIRTVLNHRYTYKKHTLLSTNWSILPSVSSADRKKDEQDLSERVGVRLLSRIMEMCEIVEVDGPDARKDLFRAGRKVEVDEQEHTFKLTASLLQCPGCRSKKIKILDQSKPRDRASKPYIEVACLCRNCSNHFLSRFFPKTAEVEYPRLEV